MKKSKPLILINFKKVTGVQAIILAEALNEVSISLRDLYDIAVIIQPDDIYGISEKTDLSLFVHDIFSEIPLHEIIENDLMAKNKLKGILINHPEKKLPNEVLNKNFDCGKRHGMSIIIVSTSIEEALSLNEKFLPDYIAIENVDLIGKDISIRESCSELIGIAISRISNRILFGAGIRTSKDIQYILNAGGAGVLLASSIIKAKDPGKVLNTLLQIDTVDL